MKKILLALSLLPILAFGKTTIEIVPTEGVVVDSDKPIITKEYFKLNYDDIDNYCEEFSKNILPENSGILDNLKASCLVRVDGLETVSFKKDETTALLPTAQAFFFCKDVDEFTVEYIKVESKLSHFKEQEIEKGCVLELHKLEIFTSVF